MSIEKIQKGIADIPEILVRKAVPPNKEIQAVENLAESINPASKIYQNQGLALHFEKLKARLKKLDTLKATEYGNRFGNDGIKSILECADSEKNIAKINKMLDGLERGEEIWTGDIVEAFNKTQSRICAFEPIHTPQEPFCTPTPLIKSQDDITKAMQTPVSTEKTVAGYQNIAQVMQTSFDSHVVGPIKEILTKKSQLPEVIALEKEMQSMGYNANFSDNLETAQIITKAYRTMTEKGCKMPKEVALMVPEKEGILGFRPFSTKENRFNVPILFNKTLKHEAAEAPQWLSNLGIKCNASDSPESVIYHEIGHFLHEVTRPSPKEANEIWQKMANNGCDIDMAKEVGFYAMTGDKFNTGEEFIAEVFAGLMEGKTYGKRVMDLYKALKGPAL